MSELQEPEILRTFLETLATGVYVVDRERKIVFWNEGAERISGYLRQEVVGRACRSDILVHCDEAGRVLCTLACPVAETLLDGRRREQRVYLKHKSGHRVPVLARVMPVRDGRGCIIGAAESFSEVGETPDRDPLTDLMAQCGCLDGRTGIPHQSYTRSRLRERLVILEEHRLPFGVVLFEVEHEEAFLAARGRDATNLVLRSVIQTMKNELCPTDFLGRWDGDRLVAILDRDAAGFAEATQRAQKLANVSEIQWWGDALSVSVKLGAVQARSGDTLESLLQRAEEALSNARERAGDSHNEREQQR